MTRVEVLAPLRIETHFRPGPHQGWTLHLRVYPEDYSLGRSPTPPTRAELEVLQAALDAADEDSAFRATAAALGPRRAWWLWRTATELVDQGAGPTRRVSVNGIPEPETVLGSPVGLPDELAVWIVRTDGTRELLDTLVPDAAEIVADLQPETVNTVRDALNGAGRPPWWLDYGRAQEVGLAAAIPLTEQTARSIATLVVVGSGSTAAADLVRTHVDSGRLTLLGPGVPTNSFGGEHAGRADETRRWSALRDGHASEVTRWWTRRVLRAFGVQDAALDECGPVPTNSLEAVEVNRLVVTVLWPVLWGRMLHDVVGAPESEPVLAEWAAERLAVQGPLPALQVDDQPYGLLPTSVFHRWRVDPAGEPQATWLEQRVVSWARDWRALAAGGAVSASPVPGASPMVGASASQVLGLYGRHAPSAHWRVRPVLDLPHLQALRLAEGLRLPVLTAYDRATSAAWRDTPYPQAPVAAAGTRRHLPSSPYEQEDDPDGLLEMLDLHPEPLYGDSRPMGLLGHLLRESLIISRARVGRAWKDMNAGRPTDVLRPFPLDDEFVEDLMHGSDLQVEELQHGADAEGQLVAERFVHFKDMAQQLVRVLAHEDVTGTLRAALDTASFRVDPWLTGVATQRLESMGKQGAAFLGGAYGWVDAPRPWTPGDPAASAPGPTAAGLLHAPSYTHAQVAAVLRDAAVKDPADDRWRLRLTSDLVRRAVGLGERVRLGVHPCEALGLEVEAVAGDPDLVRLLRRHYPTTPEETVQGGAPQPNDPTRRVCDGLAVLDAARTGALPTGVRGSFAQDVRPLEEVLDAYADLLLVDGVHALMTRSPEAGGAAMEAAAGLATPPELWGVRTPREASAVSVSCWVVLPPGGAPAPGGAPTPGGEPAVLADPAFAALVPAGSLDVPADPRVTRMAAVLGGAEVAAEVPSSHHHEVAQAMVADLASRWQSVWDLARAALATVEGLDPQGPATPGALADLDRQWRIGLRPEQEGWTTADRVQEAREELERRTWPDHAQPVPSPPSDLAGLREGVRSLVGRPELPVLPLVGRGLLPSWSPDPPGKVEKRWLEIVAAVRPRLQALEVHQLTATEPWPAMVTAHEQAPGADPWSATGPVQVVFGDGMAAPADTRVAVAMLDAWTDFIPGRHHVTQAAFGFNAPKTRAPQAVLLAVPPDLSQPLEGEALLDVVLEVRELALARAARPTDRDGLPVATPSPVVQLEDPVNLLRGWP